MRTAPGASVGLHDTGQAALGGIENHAHVASGGLVLDRDAARAPEFKVVAAAQAFPVGQRPGEGEGGIERHGAGHEGLRALRVGRIDGYAIGVVGVSAEGGVRAVD